MAVIKRHRRDLVGSDEVWLVSCSCGWIGNIEPSEAEGEAAWAIHVSDAVNEDVIA